jgi:hypothetical protein
MTKLMARFCRKHHLLTWLQINLCVKYFRQLQGLLVFLHASHRDLLAWHPDMNDPAMVVGVDEIDLLAPLPILLLLASIFPVKVGDDTAGWYPEHGGDQDDGHWKAERKCEA